MPRFITTALACLVLVPAGALVAGCGSDDETASTSTPAAEPAETTGGDTTEAAESSGDTVAVSMKNSKMVPDAITVKVDQKIEWTNDDGYDHNVTATEGADFESGNMPAGAKFDYTPTAAGKIDYVCTIHTGQNGTITVTG